MRQPLGCGRKKSSFMRARDWVSYLPPQRGGLLGLMRLPCGRSRKSTEGFTKQARLEPSVTTGEIGITVCVHHLAVSHSSYPYLDYSTYGFEPLYEAQLPSALESSHAHLPPSPALSYPFHGIDRPSTTIDSPT